jgi:hypothetical protein
MCVVAVLLAAIPPTYRWYKWRYELQSLHQWAATLKREQNHCESKTIQLPNGRWLAVYTAEVSFSEDYSRATWSGQPVKDRGFFVVPPGTWVESPEDVVRLCDEYD